jgi:hypothetical protein
MVNSLRTIEEMIKLKDVIGIRNYMKENHLKIEGNKIVPADSYAQEQKHFYSGRQQTR